MSGGVPLPPSPDTSTDRSPKETQTFCRTHKKPNICTRTDSRAFTSVRAPSAVSSGHCPGSLPRGSIFIFNTQGQEMWSHIGGPVSHERQAMCSASPARTPWHRDLDRPSTCESLVTGDLGPARRVRKLSTSCRKSCSATPARCVRQAEWSHRRRQKLSAARSADGTYERMAEIKSQRTTIWPWPRGS